MTMVITGMDCRFGGGVEGVGTENSIQLLTNEKEVQREANYDAQEVHKSIVTPVLASASRRRCVRLSLPKKRI